jgi:hypothetical protein
MERTDEQRRRRRRMERTDDDDDVKRHIRVDNLLAELASTWKRISVERMKQKQIHIEIQSTSRGPDRCPAAAPSHETNHTIILYSTQIDRLQQ